MLEPVAPGSGPRITGFSGARVVIDGVAWDGPVVVTPAGVRAWDGYDLDAALGDDTPEFLLHGSGATLVRTASVVRGVPVDTMTTRAAARAWNLLRAEGRMIVAALA